MSLSTCDRIEQAKKCLEKGKFKLNESRNTKMEIKFEVYEAFDTMYALVMGAEIDREDCQKLLDEKEERERKQTRQDNLLEEMKRCLEEQKKLIAINTQKIEEQKTLTIENTQKVDELKVMMEKKNEEQKTLIKENTQKAEELKGIMEKKTYAGVASVPTRTPVPEGAALHSVVVTSKDYMETGEDILGRIRTAVKANEGWVTVEKVRKAKDRKIIVGCRTEEERLKLKEKLSSAADHLKVEDIKNKDPLVILKDVLGFHSDDDIIKALRNQNRNVFETLKREDDKVEIRYRRRTRNPHTCHIVMRVSPQIWQRITRMEVVHIDLQRVRVADQSPLVQCSMCLGYGHGRRFCTETLEKCCHCGGPHKKSECADWLAGAVPSCANCTRAKADRADHNAFSSDCPIRKKWDELARATVAYS